MFSVYRLSHYTHETFYQRRGQLKQSRGETPARIGIKEPRQKNRVTCGLGLGSTTFNGLFLVSLLGSIPCWQVCFCDGWSGRWQLWCKFQSGRISQFQSGRISDWRLRVWDPYALNLWLLFSLQHSSWEDQCYDILGEALLMRKQNKIKILHKCNTLRLSPLFHWQGCHKPQPRKALFIPG